MDGLRLDGSIIVPPNREVDDLREILRDVEHFLSTELGCQCSYIDGECERCRIIGRIQEAKIR